MGSVCCVAAKDRTIPSSIGAETFHSNSIYSWGIQGNRRGRSMSEIDGGFHEIPSRIIRHRDMKMKGNLCFEAGDCSVGERNLENVTLSTSRNSPVMDEIDTSTTVHNSAKSSSPAASPEIPSPYMPNMSFSTPSTPSLTAAPVPDHHRPSSRSTPHRRRALPHSPATNSISEGSRSFVPSNRSDASHGSSDGWSMRTFTELVASSHRERWSFESEPSTPHHILPSPSSSTTAIESRTFAACAACAKPLSATACWTDSEMYVSAVLVCGHVYHATCLENMTPETGKYDPPCPLCTVGEKQVIKMTKRAQRKDAEIRGKNARISRNRVVDSFLGAAAGDGLLDRQASTSRGGGGSGKTQKFDLSFSGRRASFVKPFLRRNFSLGGSRHRPPPHPLDDLPPRKGFWSRSRTRD